MEELQSLVSCAPTAQPVSPELRATDTGVKLGYNVCYIVCGIVVEDDRVLMIQEAKPSCKGRWYLPAGRMEKNESIVTAVKREVLEETGHQFEPEALIAVEFQAHHWIRFTLTGRITGGSLKTPAQADRESIQAGWFPADKLRLQMEVKLRASDCLPLIQLARSWYQERPFTGLPVQVGHVSSSLRLITVHEESSGLHVLMMKAPVGKTSLPVCLMGQDHLLIITIQKTLKDCGYTDHFKMIGVLQMEHLGNPSGTYDGMCLSIVVRASSKQLGRGARAHWVLVGEEESEKRLKTALNGDYGCAKFIDLAY